MYRSIGSPEYWQIFLLTTQCKSVAEGVVSRPVLVSALFAPTKCLHFQTLHPRSFHFICNLHRCKRCTVLERAPNLRKFPLTAQCEFEADGVVSRPVLVGTYFAPNQGLLFQALHPRSFLFICALYWCKHCTGLEGPPNLRKFSLTALCKFEADGVVSKPVLVGTLFIPIQGLHFQAFHPLIFLFIWT